MVCNSDEKFKHCCRKV
ncbi:SEC-C metal-binding domain-containing protein [Fluviicola sp.]|nr:SEC-C domain-containing protein [Fluviicola sp.]